MKGRRNAQKRNQARTNASATAVAMVARSDRAGGGWIAIVAWCVRRWKAKGYFVLLSLPLLIASLWLVGLVAYVQGCFKVSGAGC